MPDYLSPKQKAILKRSEEQKTASNYSDAIDQNTWIGTMNSIGLGLIGNALVLTADYTSNFLFGKKKIPTAQSNCTLTATQWINPRIPISRAETIIKEGNKYGYVEIPESHLLPGDLVIATNPSNNSHHTMLVSGFTSKEQNHTFQGKDYTLPPDHPIVRYSNGTTHSSGYRKSVGLMEYLDNSDGKTDVKYYRHYDPGQREVLLPEIVVTPKGNYVPEGLKTIKINRRGGTLSILNKLDTTIKNNPAKFNQLDIIERFRKYRKGGLLLRKFLPGGVTYRRDNNLWKGSDGSTLNSAYVKTSEGWKHLDTTGTVSEVNEFGYVGVPYDYQTGKGLKELRLHIDSELNRQGFTDSYINSNYISANNLSLNAARNRDNIRNYAIKLGFTPNQVKALLMNAFNENSFSSGHGLNNALGFFLFDGSLLREYDTWASKYKNRPRYLLELEFIKNYLDKIDEFPSYIGISPDSLDSSKLKEFGIVSGYSNVPENSEVYNKWTVNPDSSSRLVYGILLRNLYASRANYERDNNKNRNNGGNSYRYTLLPAQHYAKAFRYSKEGDFTPRLLAWMFNVIFEKSGKPNASRFYDQF